MYFKLHHSIAFSVKLFFRRWQASVYFDLLVFMGSESVPNDQDWSVDVGLEHYYSYRYTVPIESEVRRLIFLATTRFSYSIIC